MQQARNFGRRLVTYLKTLWLFQTLTAILKPLWHLETLTAITAIAAAVAAISSAYTAHQQEKATFTSVLYGQEIDDLGKFLAVTNRSTNIAFALSNAISAELGATAGKSAAAEKSAVLSHFREASREMSEAEPSIEETGAALQVIAPPSYSTQADILTHGLISLRSKLDSDASRLQAMSNGASLTLKDSSDFARDARDDVTEAQKSRGRFLVLRRCAYLQLKEGRVLSDDFGAQCLKDSP